MRQTYDAIVVGSGIAGGWAAKELCEHGLETLVLERGRMVEHGKDYVTEHVPPWQFPHRGRVSPELLAEHYKVQRRTGFLRESMSSASPASVASRWACRTCPMASSRSRSR
jgi:choline dehydrogenase-like flavoprotein